MGTSKGYGGPSSGLVPSWIDDVAQPVAPAAQPNGPSQANPSQLGPAPSGPVNNDGTGSLRGLAAASPGSPALEAPAIWGKPCLHMCVKA